MKSQFTKNITIPATIEDHDLRGKIKKAIKVSDQLIYREGLRFYAAGLVETLTQNNSA